ncbi:MAG TPA: cysteine synthase family protein [Pyrinomonadaceae bacterium]
MSVTRREVSDNVVDSVVLPRLIQLGDNLYGAAFFLMKLLPARFILDRARADGLLREGSVVIETTSGTFGLALAILCNLHGYRLIIVSDPAIDPPLQRRLEDLGATVEIVREPAPVGGYQRARLDRMAELRAQHPGHFWPAQYSNRHNPGSYGPLAELFAEAIGKIDCLVGTVGSGGSVCGASSFLRLLFPKLKVVGVDTLGSVLFGQPDQKKRLLRGLGNSLMPENLDHRAFDEIHWVSAAEGFYATRELHRRHALYMGPTSGAAYLVARWWAEHNPGSTVVVTLPDEGYRYQDTVYDDAWLRANDAWLAELPSGPRLVDHPLEAGADWTCVLWNRRTYEQVLGSPFRE